MYSSHFISFLVSFLLLLRAVVGTDDANVALRKPTSQKTTTHGGDSSRAVDGKRSQNYDARSCTHTITQQHNDWWAVDLLSSYQIESVAITNRASHSDRLRDFTVYISDINPLPIPQTDGNAIGQVCINHPGILAAGGPHTFPCGQTLTGRYVYLWKRSSEALTICEFEAMGTPVPMAAVRQRQFNMFRGMKSTISPFLSITLIIHPRLNCMKTCLSASGGVATVIQLEEATGKCQCIQTSRFTSSDYDMTSAAGWVLMESKSN